jgi:hypothetical protein
MHVDLVISVFGVLFMLLGSKNCTEAGGFYYNLKESVLFWTSSRYLKEFSATGGLLLS